MEEILEFLKQYGFVLFIAILFIVSGLMFAFS